MRILFALVAVFLVVSIIDAAPKPPSKPKQANLTPVQRKLPGHRRPPLKRVASSPKAPQKKSEKNKRQIPFILPGNPVYPNFYAQPSSPLVDFQSALQAAFLSGVHYAELEKYLKTQNLTDPSGKPLPLDPKILADFDAAYGYTIGDGHNVTDLQQKLITFENIGNVNVVNPFVPVNVPVNGDDAKSEKAENSITVKDVKPADVNSSVVALPYHSGHVNPVFAPEIAPRYEIHYSPAQGISVDSLTGTSISSGSVGVAPAAPTIGSAFYGPAAFEPAAYDVGYPGFGIAPGFNSLLSPYPYPYPFAPGFDPKAIKPNGKATNGKSEQSAESTSPTYPDANSGGSSEAPPSESSSEPSSDSSATEAPQ